MLHNISFTVSQDDLRYVRLDKIMLAHFPTSTRALVTQAFETDGVRVDGFPCPKAFRPTEGSVVTLPHLLEASDRAATPQEGALDIVRIDPSILAVNKPGGQPCHPVKPGEIGTLSNIIVARYPEMAGIGGDPLMPGLLHRIDAGTSGLVLCARTSEAFDFIRCQFTARTVKKTYTAVVHGNVREAGGVSGYLAHNSSFRGKMRCVSGAKLPRSEAPLFAETFYKPIDSQNGKTVLEVTIYTGVTHQIRCQLASIGHPIVGDATYGSDRAFKGENGEFHLLHATSIAFIHPFTQKTVLLKAALPF